MPTAGTLLDYGIAINFFGNYRQEASVIGGATNKLNSSLLSLQNMLIGGGLTYGLYRFGDAMLRTAMSMEQNFASLKSSLGSSTKAIAMLDWARIKGAETPFEIGEVNQAVSMMNRLGFAKTKKMQEAVFKAVGDYAGQMGRGFNNMMSMVARASFGNWQSLRMSFGISKDTIGGMVKEQIKRTPEKFAGELEGINKAIQMVEKGKKGTEEYRMSIIKLIGVLGRGGMKNRLDTIAGAWSNVDDIVTNFMMSLMGYTQMQGTFASAIKNTIKNKILSPFMDAHKIIVAGIEEEVTSVNQLGNIGKGVGEIFSEAWSTIDTQVGNVSSSIVRWIDKLDNWFKDYQNNVAPVILFLALVKIQVEEFLSGFYHSFTTVFGFFIKAGIKVWGTLAKIVDWLGITKGKADSLGVVLGTLLGLLLGIKAFRLMSAPLKPLINGAMLAFSWLQKVFVEQQAVLMAEGVIGRGAGLFSKLASTLKYLMFPLQGAAIASWSFTASLLANPITWVVVAVVALVAWLAYLIYNWKEVGQKMQGVSDIALTLLSFFMPIVGIPLVMAKYWGDFKTIFYNIWRGIKGYATGIWLYIRAKVIQPMKKFFIDMWNSITDKATKFISLILTKFPLIKLIFEGIRTVWKGISDFIMNIWTKITDSSFIQGILKVWEGVSGAFGNAGQDFEKSMTKKYGTPDEKAKYQAIGKSAITPSIDSKTTHNNINFPGGVTIVQQPGQNGQDLANEFMNGLQNNMGKMGK